MRVLSLLLILIIGLVPWGSTVRAEVRISDATQTCLDCHNMVTPAIVADWKKSRHSQVSPAEAMKGPEAGRKISAEAVPDGLTEVSVGCAECHTLSPELHLDTFEHEGEQVHPVVTPRDCAACHPVESGQYLKNKMSRAYGNLTENALYHDLIGVVNGVYTLEEGCLKLKSPDEDTNASSCLSCHGTKVEVKGTMMRETDFGEMEFPLLSGWPNQGVGRVNPDESLGSCAACHVRHRFSMKMARQPYTCSQCHKGTDVLAYKVYEVSKHGNIYKTNKSDWDFDAAPWIVGEHFNAPTCAVCHASRLEDVEGNLIVERSHQMNDRLPWRLFGLVYAHPPTQVGGHLDHQKQGRSAPAHRTDRRAGPRISDFPGRDGTTHPEDAKSMSVLPQPGLGPGALEIFQTHHRHHQ